MQNEQNLREILIKLRRDCGTVQHLADQLCVNSRTVTIWLGESEVGLRRLHPGNIQKIMALAQERGIFVVDASRPPIWDLKHTYEDNLAMDPSSLPAPNVLPPCTTSFLGRLLNSPFGASSSVLTANAIRIAALARSGADIITYKTVRSQEAKAQKTPNAFFCGPDQLIDPDMPLPIVRLCDTGDLTSASNGMLNRFGLPSSAPEVWQADFRIAQGYLATGQVLILSIAGIPDPSGSFESYVADLLAVANLGSQAGATVFEINLSCPNSKHLQCELYRDPERSEQVCAAVRSIIPTASIILKIGYLSGDKLRQLVLKTAPYVDGYSAINSIRVDGCVSGSEEFFHQGVRGGLSGRPVLRLGLRCVRELSLIRQQEGLVEKAIIGIGGVTAPQEVLSYLESGADVVQAATIFFKDPCFGLKVRKGLVAHHKSSADLAKYEEEDALMNLARAQRMLIQQCDQKGDARKEVLIAGAEVYLLWQQRHQEILRRGLPRRRHAPGVDEFLKQIRVCISTNKACRRSGFGS